MAVIGLIYAMMIVSGGAVLGTAMLNMWTLGKDRFEAIDRGLLLRPILADSGCGGVPRHSTDHSRHKVHGLEQPAR